MVAWATEVGWVGLDFVRGGNPRFKSASPAVRAGGRVGGVKRHGAPGGLACGSARDGPGPGPRLRSAGSSRSRIFWADLVLTGGESNRRGGAEGVPCAGGERGAGRADWPAGSPDPTSRLGRLRARLAWAHACLCARAAKFSNFPIYPLRCLRIFGSIKPPHLCLSFYCNSCDIHNAAVFH